MRNYLTILVAILMLAALGCGDGKKKYANSIDNAVDRARERSQDREQQQPALPNRPNQDESAEDQTGDTDEGEGDGETSDASGEDEGDGDAEGDDDGEETASSPPPAPERRVSNARRRKRPPDAGLGGGGMSADQMRDEIERRQGGDSADDEEEEDEDEDEGSSDDSSTDQRPNIAQRPEPPQKAQVSFMDRAQLAFASQHDSEGFQYLYAHALTEDGALSAYPLAWYSAIKEPKLALRWGVGVTYQPGDYEGDPPVIGDPVSDSSSSGSSGGGGGGGDFNTGGSPSGGGVGLRPPSRRQGQRRPSGGGDAPGTGGNDSDSDMDPIEELLYYTGDFGEQFIERFEMRRVHGDAFYGRMLREIDPAFELNLPDAPDAPEEDEEDEDDSDSSESSGNGDFMTMGGTNAPPAAAQRFRNRNRNNSSDQDNEFDPGYEADATSLAPGLIMLGTGNQNELVDRASQHGVDVLVVFSVKVRHSERRNGDTSTKSNTVARVYLVKSPEQDFVSTRSLSDVSVANAREKGGDDPVEEELDTIFSETADLTLKAGDMPDLTADIAAKRIDSLLSKEYDNPLPVLVEIKSYFDSGLISDNQYVAAAEVLIGAGNATDLIDGDMEARAKALEDWLPGRYNVDTSGGRGFR